MRMKKNNIKRESLTEQIQSILIERIVNGTLQPGDRLKELQVADEFGTSQAPAREAIRILTTMGYVEHKPHIGAVVKTYSRSEIAEAYQIREALEGFCLLIAITDVQKIAGELEAELERMHAALQGNDIGSFTRADDQFHRIIVERTGNNKMFEIWDSLKIQHQMVATHVEAFMPLDELYALHPHIVSSLHKNQRSSAARYLAKHYREIDKYWKMKA